MVNFTPAFFAALSARAVTKSLAATQPLDPNDTLFLPKGTWTLASDPGSDWHYALDRNFTELGRFHKSVIDPLFASQAAAVPNNCVGATPAQIQSLPGWYHVVDWVHAHLGYTGYNIFTNWDGQQHTHICVTEDVVELQSNGQATCNTNTATLDGGIVGASGSVEISVTSGYSATSIHTVTQSSAFMVGAEVSVTVGIPEVADVSASVSASATFTNEDSRSFGTSFSNEVTQKVTIPSEQGKHCTLEITTQTCHQPTTGQVAFTAQGWYRWGFTSSVKGHYYYSWPLSSDLSTEEASSYAKFTGSVQGITRGHYKGKCE